MNGSTSAQRDSCPQLRDLGTLGPGSEETRSSREKSTEPGGNLIGFRPTESK